jgi:hypothetical protein
MQAPTHVFARAQTPSCPFLHRVLHRVLQEFEPSARLDLNDTLRLASIW